MKIFKFIMSIIFAGIGIYILDGNSVLRNMTATQLFTIPIGIFASSYAGMNLGDFISKITRPETVYYSKSSDLLYLKFKYFIGLILKGGITGAFLPYLYFSYFDSNLARIIFPVISITLAFISHILIIALDDKNK